MEKWSCVMITGTDLEAAELSTEWLMCTISPGMFNNEMIASGTTAFGRAFSAFVPTMFVQPQSIHAPTAGFVAVTVIQSKDDLVMISLPVEPMEVSQTVTVKQEQLAKVAA